MILPRISRKAAVILGKAAGAVIFAVVGGAAAWLLDKERRAIQDEAIRQSEDTEMEFSLPVEAAPGETQAPAEACGPETRIGNGDGDEA